MAQVSQRDLIELLGPIATMAAVVLAIIFFVDHLNEPFEKDELAKFMGMDNCRIAEVHQRLEANQPVRRIHAQDIETACMRLNKNTKATNTQKELFQ